VKPWYYDSETRVNDTIEWVAPREEDAWFIVKTPPGKPCLCGAASVGDWTAGKHHGLHKCAHVITSINGNKRVSI
jgi:hypothetical protein